MLLDNHKSKWKKVIDIERETPETIHWPGGRAVGVDTWRLFEQEEYTPETCLASSSKVPEYEWDSHSGHYRISEERFADKFPWVSDYGLLNSLFSGNIAKSQISLHSIACTPIELLLLQTEGHAYHSQNRSVELTNKLRQLRVTWWIIALTMWFRLLYELKIVQEWITMKFDNTKFYHNLERLPLRYVHPS